MSEARSQDGTDHPETGVRNRSGHAENIHRQDPDADKPEPACNHPDFGDDTEFKEVHIASLLGFAQWGLCQRGKCFGSESKSGDRKEALRNSDVVPDDDDQTSLTDDFGGPARGGDRA